MNKWKVVFSVLSVAISAQFSSGAAQAVEAYDTVTFEAKEEARLAVLLKNLAPNLGDVVRNADGSVRTMNQTDADSYCRNQGERLPTARELALVAQSLGAKGISEIEKEGYHLVEAVDRAGNLDRFYFSSKGYQRPSGDIGRLWFWSSSYVQERYSHQVYGLYGGDGTIVHDLHVLAYFYSAVRCVRSR